LGLWLSLEFGFEFRVFSQYYPELLALRNITGLNSQGPLNCMCPRRASPLIGMYQIILLGDRGTCVCVWTTCPGLLPKSVTARIRPTP